MVTENMPAIKSNFGHSLIELIISLSIFSAILIGTAATTARYEEVSRKMLAMENLKVMQFNVVRAVERMMKFERINITGASANQNYINSLYGYLTYQTFKDFGYKGGKPQAGARLFRKFSSSEKYQDIFSQTNQIRIGTIRNVCYTPDESITLNRDIYTSVWQNDLRNKVRAGLYKGDKELDAYYCPLGIFSSMWQPILPSCPNGQLPRALIENRPFNNFDSAKDITYYPPKGETHVVASLVYLGSTIISVNHIGQSDLGQVKSLTNYKGTDLDQVLVASAYIDKDFKGSYIKLKWQLKTYDIASRSYLVQPAVDWNGPFDGNGFPILTVNQMSD